MHDLAQSQSIVELTTEFYEDYYTEHPTEALKVLGKSGDLFFLDNEDPLLAKWESELAEGIDPDLTEGMSIQEKDKIKNIKQGLIVPQNTRTMPKSNIVDIQEMNSRCGIKPSTQKQPQQPVCLGDSEEEDWLAGLRE